jgi:hypothetical protein
MNIGWMLPAAGRRPSVGKHDRDAETVSDDFWAD